MGEQQTNVQPDGGYGLEPQCRPERVHVAPPEVRLSGGRAHPLCPACGYDLVAAPSRGTCSECGFEYEASDRRRARRAGDWTLARGLRRLAVSLAWRIAVSLLIWTGGLVLFDRLFAAMPVSGSSRIALAALLIGAAVLGALGVIVGVVIARRLDEIAGFEGVTIGVAAVGAALVVVIGGALLAPLFMSAAFFLPGPSAVIASIAAGVTAAKLSMFADY